MRESIVKSDASYGVSLADNIYNELKKRILSVYLCPGMIISIRNLCEYFQAGRSPVRDAVMRLEQEGLVNILPQRGVMISLINMDIESQERFIRVALEEAVMRQFIAEHTQEQLEELEKLLEEQRSFCESSCEDTRQFLQLDDDFHMYFYKATKRELCMDVQKTKGCHYYRVRMLHCTVRLNWENYYQHVEIFNAVKAKDVEAMIRAFRFHLEKLGQEEHELLLRYPYLFKQNVNCFKQSSSLDVDYLRTVV